MLGPDARRYVEQSGVGFEVVNLAEGRERLPQLEREIARTLAAEGAIRIEQTIRRFEPRLSRIRVTLTDGQNTLESVLRLRIEALLRIEPAPEPIAFDTLVNSATAEVQVKAGSPDLTAPADV